ncbi:hypothetical protein CAPTEDRAFT_207399 [Capitella teleta]|uniref:Centrosome-associated FAM110 C-terminal domain-containing protein n=1 Tax=Capitella teleta TaxID=283909 RepID=R7ULC0_CAPTE|nr:hypothetical protein CAPTEDRAFT_207399 [Capitella teleta]|eukprot:ELU04598.1 hypothetical protein CAPTEDRAFT_207399 [Capitella teleta]
METSISESHLPQMDASCKQKNGARSKTLSGDVTIPRVVTQQSTDDVKELKEGTAEKLSDARLPSRKVMSRSRSDLTKRFSNSSDLTELGLKCSRNSADLEKFFNEMGLDRSVLDPALHFHAFNQSTSSLNAYENMSSAGSPWDTISWSSVNSDADIKPLTSSGERNARVARWLSTIRRSATGSNSSLSLAHYEKNE